MRKGMSFTLTLVVVGVILLMTALSVITLGGSSIKSFFQSAGQQREQAEQTAAIRDACQAKIREINRKYCEDYVKTANYQDSGVPAGTLNQIRKRGDFMNDTTMSGGVSGRQDHWVTVDKSIACSAGPSQRKDGRIARSSSAVAVQPDTGTGAYEQTATGRSCNWYQNSAVRPTVTVEGNTYNCLNRGFISQEVCPAE